MQQKYESNIWKFYTYKILTSLDITVSIFVLFLLANSLSMTQVMILQSVYTFFIFLFEIPSGVFADMYGRKTSLILSSLFLTIAFLVFGFNSLYLIFFIAVFLKAIAKSLLSGADVALLFDSLKSINKTKLFSRFNGRSNSLEMLTLGISSVIGGTIATYYGNRILFFLSAIIFMVSLFFAFSFYEPKKHYKKIIEKNYIQHLKEATKFSFTNNTVRYFLLYFSIFGFFAFMLYYLIQPFFTQENTKLFVGIAVAGYFIFCSLGSFVSEHIIKRFKTKKLLVTISLISAFAFFLIPLTNKYIAVGLVFINSFIVGVAGVLANQKINENTESHHRATVLSVLNFTQKLIYAIVAPFIGYIADIYTLNATFIVLGIGLFLLFTYYLILFLIDRKSPTL